MLSWRKERYTNPVLEKEANFVRSNVLFTKETKGYANLLLEKEAKRNFGLSALIRKFGDVFFF